MVAALARQGFAELGTIPPAGGRPTVRVKGRTHPESTSWSETLTSSPRDADAGRQWKEGSMPNRTSRTCLARVPEEAGQRTAAGAAADRSRAQAGDGAARRRAGLWLLQLARAEGRNRSAAPTSVARFFDGLRPGDVERCASLLDSDPRLARVDKPRAHHTAAGPDCTPPPKAGTLDAVRLLLEHGADPNAREAGDNTYPLHWAAARGHLDVVRALLDAGRRRPRHRRRARARRHRLGDVLSRARTTDRADRRVTRERRVAPARARRRAITSSRRSASATWT